MYIRQSLAIFASCVFLVAGPGGTVRAAEKTEVQLLVDGHFPALLRTLRTGGGPCGKSPTTYCGGMEAGNMQALYTTQIATTTLLLYLRAQMELPEPERDPGTAHMVDLMAQLYAIPFENYLEPGTESSGQQFEGWICGSVCERTVGKGLGGKEVPLCSVQFAFGASRTMRLITQLPRDQRSEAMSRLLAHAPYLAETYVRWTTGDHRQRLDPGKPGFPAGDVGIQAAAGIAELTASLDAMPETSLPDETVEALHGWMNHYWRDVLQGRGRFSRGPGDPNKEVWVWDQTLTARNYGSKFLGGRYRNPSSMDKAPATLDDVLNSTAAMQPFTLDMAHYARVPDAVESFRQRLEFRDEAERILRGIAQQTLQEVWNGDSVHPRWTNYADGSDGWFGLKLSGRVVSSQGALGPGKLVPNSPALLARYLWTMRYEPEMASMAKAVETAFPGKYKYRTADRVSALSLIPMQDKYLLK